MEVVSLLGTPSAAFRWRFGSGAWRVTVVTKATYSLIPLKSERSTSEQVPIHAADEHRGGEPSRSLITASDLVPCKLRPEIVITGSAFAADQRPVRSLVARAVVGDLEKTVEVLADRAIAIDGSLREGPPFSRMPLVYERAAGGPDTWNPVGVGPHARDASGSVRLANLVPPGTAFDAPACAPVGLGPIAPRWSPRTDLLRAHAATWRHGSYGSNLVVPDDLDLRYFNAAPADQQLEAPLPGGLHLVLDHLHPTIARLSTYLPEVRPHVVATIGARRETVAMVADTVAIDTEAARCTITFRALLSVDGPDEPLGLAVIDGAGSLAEALRTTELGTMDPADPQTPAVDVTQVGTLGNDQPLLPFEKAAPAAPRPRPEGDQPKGGLPFAQPVSPSAPPPPVAAVRPGAGPGAYGLVKERPTYLSQAAPEPRAAPGVSHAPEAAREGAVAASDAAAGTSTSAPPKAALEPRSIQDASPVSIEREVLEIVWADDAVVEDARRSRALRRALASNQERRGLLSPDDAGRTDELKRARDLARVLGHREPIDEARALEAALGEAVEETGALGTPIVVVSAELIVRLDPRKVIEAMVGILKPFVGADRALADAVEQAQSVAQNEWTTSRAVEGTLSRLRDAAGRSHRDLPAAGLQATAERLVLDRRGFETRSVLGGEHVRADLHFGGGSPAVPIYLPLAAKERLPLFDRFPARAVAEVRPRQDAVEPHPLALRGRAVARRLPRPGTR